MNLIPANPQLDPNIRRERALYLDYFNNFLTVAAFAEHYNMSVEDATELIERERDHPDNKPQIKTPVNGIQIPKEFVVLAKGWYDGVNCLLYAIASTGNLTLGNRRPQSHWTDEMWYLSLWDGLDVTLMQIINALEKNDGKDHEDYPMLKQFQEYAEKISDRLRDEYDLNAIDY